jgi:signal peptidase I
MAKAKKRIGEVEQRAAEGAAADKPEEAAPPRGIVREYFESAVVTVIMALFFMTFVAQAATVPSASMENTIFVGDHFLINKFIFAPGPSLPILPQREIRRGDVIVFRYPAESIPSQDIVQYKTFFIKRVIGLPGETVEVRGSQVLINGRPTPEHRIEARDSTLGSDMAELRNLHPQAKSGDETYSVYYSPETLSYAPDTPPDLMRRNSRQEMKFAVFEPHRLADDEYFVMGDNRDNSKDSRFWGPVKRDLVVGRAMFVIWSYDESAPKQRGLLGPVVNFFTNSRWSRIGTLIH